MKLSTIAFALTITAAVPAAHSQSSVSLFGLVDQSIAHITNVNAAKDSVTKMPSNSSIPSRWGLRGTEDLGNGYKAGFVLESGFSLDTGASMQGGRLFGRQAHVSLSTPYGTVTLGRQYSMLFYSLFGADQLGPNLFGSASLDPYIANDRTDNAIGFLGRTGGFQYGATYSFGRDAAATGGPAATNCAGESATDRKACRQWTALLKYDAPTWGIAGAYDKLHGGPGVVFGGPAALNNSAYYEARTTVNGYVQVGGLRVSGGWIGRTNRSAQSFRQDMVFAAVGYALTPALFLDAQAFRYTKRHSDDDTMMYVARAIYSLSKRTAVYVTGGYLTNSGNAANSLDGMSGAGPGLNQIGVAAGIRHAF
ncbi:porin [Pigmentiphaga sp.]|uniref:porin n=1 Tax=Pigmentiphaga sp. TaxID=1977564 RepID=UPI0025F886D5|nr:porin [Pigmentiphaga sp.]